MKNLIVAVAALLATATTAFASGGGNDPKSEKLFCKQFTGAQNVKWYSIQDGYQRVVFTLNGVSVEAFYDESGEFVGTVRNLFFNQLPLRVMQSVNNRFEKPVVIEVKEISDTEGTLYKVVLEQSGKKYNVKLDSYGTITDKSRVK